MSAKGTNGSGSSLKSGASAAVICSQQAAQALGMEVSDPSQTEPAALSAGTVSATVKGGGQTVQKTGTKEIKIEFSGDQHFHNGQDADSLAAKIKQALIDELQKRHLYRSKGGRCF